MTTRICVWVRISPKHEWECYGLFGSELEAGDYVRTVREMYPKWEVTTKRK
jgi:hypothetical protein